MDPTLRAAFRARDPVVGSWVLVGHPLVAELTAELGFDFVVLDTEHPSYSLETVDRMIAGVAAASGDASPLVRVPLAERNRIGRVLNMGAAGIIVPMVETPEQAREAVEAVRYPPEGDRTIAPGRGSRYLLEFEEYVTEANEGITTILMIESERGVENAAAIAGVDGVDAILVGHEDLSMSLNIFAEWENQRLADAIDEVVAAAAREGTAVGRVTPDPETIPDQAAVGYDYLIAGVDLWHLTQALGDSLTSFEAAFDR